MKIISLIPARGGSKGIPKKNLSVIAGTTLLGLKVAQAKMTLANEIWVSTDNPEIKAEAIKNGAYVLDRPDSLSTDEASTDSMLIHAVECIPCEPDDIIVLLQTTSPLIEVNSINSCISQLIENKSLGSVITIRESHPFMWVTKNGFSWEPSGHTRDLRPRRQDLDRGGWETGGCYAIRVSAIQKQGVRYPAPTGTVNVSFLESIDIDTPQDLEMARNLLD